MAGDAGAASAANSGWEGLLAPLTTVARENGTAALQQTADFLRDFLAAQGVDVELIPFLATPYRLRLAGVLILAGGVAYFALMRRGRPGPAFLVALFLPVLLLAELDYQAPLFGRIGAQTEYHVRAVVPAAHPEARLIFTAHYDSKTDLLDHVERAPVEAAGLPVVAAMIAGAFSASAAGRRGRRARFLRGFASFATWAALAYGVAGFAALSAGALVPERSPGALDDGASCAVLARLAADLAAAPPQRTDVEVILLAAEEVGVQGSYAYAAERFAGPPDLPTYVVNLEGLGESRHLAVLGGEAFTLRTFEPAPEVVALLDRVVLERTGEPLALTPYPGGTDARSFLAHGVPAATLVSLPEDGLFTRDLHSAGDDRSRVDEGALDDALSFLHAVVGAADAGAL